MYRRLETQEYIVPLYRWGVCVCVCVCACARARARACVYMLTDMMHYFELKEWCGFLQISMLLDANTSEDIIRHC